MRKAEVPFLADWFAISFRWLALFGLTTAVGLAEEWSVPILILLILSAIWNGFVTLLAVSNRRLPGHRAINVAVDVVTGMLLYFSGSGEGVLAWAGLLPLISAAIYYEWLAALVAAVALSVVQTGLLFIITGPKFTWLYAGVITLVNCAAGGIMGYLAKLLMRYIRRNYQRSMNQRREIESRVKLSERERMRVLYSMTETLSGTLDYQVVLDSALDLSIASLEENDRAAADLAAAVLLFREDLLVVEAIRRFPAHDSKVSLPVEDGVLLKTMQSGAPQLITSPSDDPELHQLSGLQGMGSLLCLPLIRGLNAFGFMLYAHPRPDFFSPEKHELLEMISRQAVIAIHNARLYTQLQQENERILETQEETRKKLARDLHDGPTQSVAAIAMRASIARKLFERDQNEGLEELMRIEDLARRTTQEIRHMLFTLRPLVLESEGLESALTTMATRMRDTYQQNVVIDVDAAVIEQLEISKQTAVFYIVEEAVNNARKHASASKIEVHLKAMDSRNTPEVEGIALLEVADDGQGFDMQSVTKSYDRRGSLGMVNLSERTELVNGLLQIKSAPGKGTRVRVYIPLTPEAADRLHHRT